MENYTLINMMLEESPIEDFEELLKTQREKLNWLKLLEYCYTEESYESVGGDLGYMDNPPINYKRIEYLNNLIAFLENNGIKAK